MIMYYFKLLNAIWYGCIIKARDIDSKIINELCSYGVME